MQRYEFTVIPAPRRGEKTRGARTTEARFAQALTTVMNRMGAEGWDYVRADVLPCDERVGLTGLKTTYQNMLVFRRVIEPPPAAAPAVAPAVSLAVAPATPVPPPLVLGATALGEEGLPARLGASLAPQTGGAPALGAAAPPASGQTAAPPVTSPRSGAPVE